MSDRDLIFKISKEEWSAAYLSSIPVYPGTRFVVVPDGNMVRIAFGTHGAPIDEAGARSVPIYHAAIYLDGPAAVQLRDLLNEIIKTQPVTEPVTGD